MKKEKQVVYFHSRGPTGNVHWILGAVRQVMQKERRIVEFNDMCEAVQNCGDYEEALCEIGKHVILADRDTLRVYKDGVCRRYDPDTGKPIPSEPG